MPERSPKIVQDVQFEYFQGPGFLLELKESWALEQTPRLLHFNGSTSSATTSLVAQETWYDPDYDEICTLEKLPKDRLWRSQFLVKPDAIRYPMPSKRLLVWWLFVHFSTVSGLQTPWNAIKSSRSTSLYWRFIERVLFRRPPLHKPFIGMKLEPGECPEAVRFTFRHYLGAVIGPGTDVEHVNSSWHERYICRGGDYDDKLVTDLAPVTQYNAIQPSSIAQLTFESLDARNVLPRPRTGSHHPWYGREARGRCTAGAWCIFFASQSDVIVVWCPYPSICFDGLVIPYHHTWSPMIST